MGNESANDRISALDSTLQLVDAIILTHFKELPCDPFTLKVAMMDIIKFYNNNKDVIDFLFGSGIVFVVLGAIARLIYLLIRRYSASRKRIDTNPFQIIPPQSDIARLILGGEDNNPFAARNIPYQTRITGRNIRRELESAFEGSHWLLILAHTGIGKTREAINLLQTLNQEGWTILNLTREGWLDAPAHLPHGMPDRKLVFFLDDLNRKCYASRVEQSPQAGEVMQPLTIPLQDRLRRALEAYAVLCGGMSEIRVVATARDETLPDAEKEPSPWDMLQFDNYSDFWNQFAIYRLPPLDALAGAKALEDTAAQAHVKIDADPVLLARRNDGTFANIVQNLESAHIEQTTLTLENFRDSLKGTWEKRYQAAIRKYPAARNIYDAVELLREIGIDLEPFIVKPTARLIADGDMIQRMQHWWQIRIAIRYLISAESILSPSDGQIEAKGTRIDLDPYLFPLQSLFLRLTWYTASMSNRLLALAYKMYDRRHFDRAAKLYRRAVFLNPKNLFAHLLLGGVYSELDGRRDDAIIEYLKAIELDPKYAPAHNSLGLFYSQMDGRRDDAIIEYLKAIELNPKDADAHRLLGEVYEKMDGRRDDAIIEYLKAIELDPTDAFAHRLLGEVYEKMDGRRDDVIAEYLKAIELNPKDAFAHNSLGLQYSQMDGRLDFAIAEVQTAIDLDPTYVNAHNGLGFLYKMDGRRDDAIAEFLKAIDLDPKNAFAHRLLVRYTAT